MSVHISGEAASTMCKLTSNILGIPNELLVLSSVLIMGNKVCVAMEMATKLNDRL